VVVVNPQVNGVVHERRRDTHLRIRSPNILLILDPCSSSEELDDLVCTRYVLNGALWGVLAFGKGGSFMLRYDRRRRDRRCRYCCAGSRSTVGGLIYRCLQRSS
jgi:hypothetical protein